MLRTHLCGAAVLWASVAVTRPSLTTWVVLACAIEGTTVGVFFARSELPFTSLALFAALV
jgi:hypothetical protein